MQSEPKLKVPKKVVVIGSSCAGKTTFAGTLARTHKMKHVELDALFWKPNWQESETEAFRAKVLDALSEASWVVDGNYTSRIHDIVWSQADTVVWLDPSLPTILFRFLRRSLKRSLTGEVLWGTCKETLRSNIFQKNSLLVWILTTRRGLRRRYAHWSKEPPYPNVSFYRLKSNAEVQRFLRNSQK